MGGLASRMPVTRRRLRLAALSTAGMPPLSGFWSKLIIIVALWQTGHPVLAILAVAVSVLTLAYMLLMQRRVFFGQLRAGLESIREARGAWSCRRCCWRRSRSAVGVAVPFVPQVYRRAEGGHGHRRRQFLEAADAC